MPRPKSLRPASLSDPRDSIPFLLRNTHRQMVRALESELEARGLGSTHWYFLRVLWTEEGMTQAELSAQVGVVTPATVSALNSLERRGLIERRADERDRRKARIHLTPKGRALEDELMPIAQRVLSNALRGISKEDIRICRKVLGQIQTNYLSTMTATRSQK